MASTEHSEQIRKVRIALRQAMDGTTKVRFPDDEVLDQALQVATDVAGLIRNGDAGLDQERFDAIGWELPVGLKDWLLEMPSFLAIQGRTEQGLGLCDLLAPVLGEAYVEIERAVTHFESEQADEARAIADRCREQFPEHHWVIHRRGFLAEREGDEEKAEELYRQAIERAREAGILEELHYCYSALINLKQEQGEEDQALELRDQLLAEVPKLDTSGPIVNESPAVGRNDPCPCGSGKKYKKCCM